MIRNISITRQNIDLSKFPEAIRKNVAHLVSDHKYEKIYFELVANCAIANAIRTVVMEEIKVKCLEVKYSEISTTMHGLPKLELATRIGFIKLDQSTPLSTTFELHCNNNDSAAYSKVFDASHLKSNDGKKYFDEKFGLCELDAGTSVDIKNIRVVEGYGYDNARFIVTTDFTYDIIDYVEVIKLSEKGNFINARVRRTDLEKVAGKGATDHGAPVRDIILVPSKDIPIDKELTDGYKLIYADIPSFSSEGANPQEFALSFRTHGNMPAKDLVILGINTIIERLEAAKASADIPVEHKNETYFIIPGEYYVMAGLIESEILEIVPDIPYVTGEISHPDARECTIRLQHPKPADIYLKAVESLIVKFRKCLTDLK